jgi:hypothetical protein
VERVLNGGRDVISLRRESLSADTIRHLMTARSVLVLEDKMEKNAAVRKETKRHLKKAL